MREAFATTAASYYSVGAYRANEGLFVITNGPTTGSIPVVYAHGALDTALAARTAPIFDDLDALANLGFPALAGDWGTNGGSSKWANDDSVTAAEAGITYGNSAYGTRTDRIILFGDSMGSLLCLNLAMANPARVAALILRGPVFDFEAFYDRNSEFQAGIDAAYTNHTGFLNALPTKDPARNLAKLRPLGNRMGVWYAHDDEYIDRDEAHEFCRHFGVRREVEIAGTHLDITSVSSEEIAEFVDGLVGTP